MLTKIHNGGYYLYSYLFKDKELNKINDKDIVNIVNEVPRPFRFISEFENVEDKKCGDCKHLVRKERLIGLYYEPYFVCDLSNSEIDWPYRDSKPNDCTLPPNQ